MYYKKSRYGKLKPFDYLNRTLILGLIIAIAILGFQIVQKNISIASNNTSLQSSKSSIIYTPINYQMDNAGDTNQDATVDNNSSSNSDTAENSPKIKKTLLAHSPTTANMSDIIIDEPSDK